MSLPAGHLDADTADFPLPDLVTCAGSEVDEKCLSDDDDDNDSIADVEVNVDSRFIDFSLVTPWEHLVAELEKAIKLWSRHKG